MQTDKSSVRASGKDDVINNSDDLLTHYVFDNYGRAITAYTTNEAKTVIYGVSSGEYTPALEEDGSETSPKKANKLVSSSVIGKPTESILPEDEAGYEYSYGSLVASGEADRGNVIKLTGDLGIDTFARKLITLESPYASGYTLSGWGKAASVPTDGSADFGFYVVVNYSDGTSDITTASFNTDTEEWQYMSTAVLIDSTKTASTIDIICIYNNNYGDAYLDGITLVPSTDSVKYVYNEEGKVVKSVNGSAEFVSYNYSSENLLTSASYYDGSSYSYSYNQYKSPSTEIYRKNGSTLYTTYYTYDTYGNLKKEKTTAYTSGNSMISEYTYSENTAYFGKLLTATDTNGDKTTNIYNGTGLYCGLLSATAGNDGKGYSYSYDLMGRLKTVYPATVSGTTATVETSAESVNYTYTGSDMTRAETESTQYNFVYDSFGNQTAIKIGTGNIVSYTYNANNGKLITVSYANGYSIKYAYDSLERVNAVYESTNGSSYSLVEQYTYSDDGRIVGLLDNKAGIRYTYTYDSAGRVKSTTAINVSTNTVVYSSTNTYDTESKISSQTRGYGNVNESYTYTYDSRDRLSRVSSTYGLTDYSYDLFSRITGVTQSYGSATLVYSYGYKDLTDRETNRIDQFNFGVSNSQSTVQRAYTYTYDSAGRITGINVDGVLTYSYEYDNLGQLTRENNRIANKTYVYTYDNAGNITSKKTYNYTTGTPSGTYTEQSYTYGNSTWGDQLTAVGGTSITYDAIGNPTQIGNVNLAWQGRRLMSYGSNTYTYNAEGIRTSKTVNNVTHTYTLEGSTIIAENYTGVSLRFLYDNTGVIGVYYNNTLYMYEKNLQGDVVALISPSLERVVEYTYDAWGNILSISGSMASTVGAANPIRYRSYYYDTETGWYYLQSRYYNPNWGRFVNADDYISTGTGFIGFNMYAYCNNNPVMYVDSSGYMAAEAILGWWTSTVGAVAVVEPTIIGEVALIVGTAVLTTVVAVEAAKANAKEKAKAKEKKAVIPAPPNKSQDAVYYGARVLAGQITYLTEAMTLNEAVSWTYTSSATMGKNTPWGVYTKNRSDAEILGLVIMVADGLSGDLIEELNGKGQYWHFHLPNRLYNRKHKNFHIWYGDITK